MNSRRRVNSDVMRLPLIASLILFYAAGVAHAQTQGIFDPFDRWHGNKSTEEENIRLDNFSVALERNPDWIGYILVLRRQNFVRRRNATTRYSHEKLCRYGSRHWSRPCDRARRGIPF